MGKIIVSKTAGIGLLIVLLATGWNTSAGAESDPEKAKDIRKLLVVSGLLEQMGYMKTSLLNAYSSGLTLSFPKAPDEFWREYYDLIGDREMEDLIDRVIPVYDKHMSHEAVKKLIKMFETPFWEEWKAKMPAISREAGMIGSHWGQEIVQSDTFSQRVDGLVKQYDLEKLNAGKKQ